MTDFILVIVAMQLMAHVWQQQLEREAREECQLELDLVVPA